MSNDMSVTPSKTILRPATEISEFFFSPMVTVRVGTDEPKDFYIHKERLCQYSPFFKSALDKDWSEAKSNIITLPEDTPETFGIYCDWLYNISPFRESAAPIKQDEATKNVAFNIETGRYYRAYVFGDKVLDRDFTDMLIDHLVIHMRQNGCYATDHLFKIFNLSPKGHPVRQLLIDVILHAAHEQWFSSAYWNNDTYREALSEITQAFILHKNKPLNIQDAPYYKPALCKYHSHAGTDTPCYKTQRGWGWLREREER